MDEDARSGPDHKMSEKQRCLSLIRDEYLAVVQLGRLDLEQLNTYATSDTAYRSMNEVFRDYFGRANAVANFAVRFGLIDSLDAHHLLRQFQADHPHFFEEEGGVERPGDE